MSEIEPCDRCSSPPRYKVVTTQRGHELVRLLCSGHFMESQSVLDLHHVDYRATVLR